LHELPKGDSEHPAWYSRTFAKTLAGVVLPGYTAFSPDDTLHAFDLMQAQGINARFKDPSNTGGLGQYLVRDRTELEEVMALHVGKFKDVGAIIEADLQDHHTVTVGRVDLNGQVYSWHGRPYDVRYNGTTRFGGNELTVVRGEPGELMAHAHTAEDKLAIEQSGRVFEVYDLLDSTITRATLDAVQGVGSNGQFMSGITDPSLRPSASSAGEIRAIEAFVANPDAEVVTTRLTYDYPKELEPAANRELFVAHKRMNIFVELVDVA